MLFSAEQPFLVTHLGCKICVSCPTAGRNGCCVLCCQGEQLHSPGKSLLEARGNEKIPNSGKLLNSHCFLLVLLWIVTGSLHPPGSAAPVQVTGTSLLELLSTWQDGRRRETEGKVPPMSCRG